MKTSFHIRGASMVQALVAAGLFAAMFLGIVNIINEQAKTSRSSSLEFEMVYTTDEIKSLLSDPSICTTSLKGLNPKSSSVQSLKRVIENNQLLELYPTLERDPDALYGQENLKIASYRISDKGPEVDVQAGTSEFIINYATREEVAIQQERRLRLYLALDNDGLIDSCETNPGLGQTQSRESSVYELWNLSPGRRSHFTKETLVLGQPPSSNNKDIEPALDQGLIQEHGLLFLATHAAKNCQKQNEGALRYSSELRKMQLCASSGNWEDLSGHAFNPRAGKFYATRGSSQTPLEIGPKAYCTLFKTDVSSGECSLSQGPNGDWQLKAQGQKTTCQALCYSN